MIGPRDALAAALCDSELDEARVPAHLPVEAVHELFAAAAALRRSVPFATLRLLARLAEDDRPEVRAGVARALPEFADAYPDAVEELLMRLAGDARRAVQKQAIDALATRRSTVVARGD